MRLSLLILLQLLVVSLTAQQYYFANYTLNDGLPHSRVNDVYQSEDGYLWLATNLGLSRFDGRKFNNYSMKDGLADNKVTCLFGLPGGDILLGHENGMLSVYSTSGLIRKFSLEPANNRIFSIEADHSGFIWICTQSSGVYRIKADQLLDHLEKKEYVNYGNAQGLARDVTGVLEDEKGSYWFVTDLGIKRSKSESGPFEFYLPKEIDFVQFSSIAEDDNHDIWLGTVTAGVYRINQETGAVQHYSVQQGGLPNNFISCLQGLSGGGMLIGTWGGGFSYFDGQHLETISELNGLSENKVRCMQKDREGNIWIGSNQNGVSCYRGKEFHLFLKSKDGTNTQIGAILQDKKGNRWMGSSNGIYYTPKGSAESRKIDFITGGDDVEVTSLLEDKVGRIWVSTWGAGILIITPGTFEVSRFTGKLPYSEPGTFTEQYVHTVKQSKSGSIWISMLRGVSHYNPSNNTLSTYTTRDGLSENNTTDIEEDLEGNLWIGSAGGGLTVRKQGKFSPFENKDLSVYASISSITSDPKGHVWIATEGGGLYRWDGSKMSRFTSADGLSSNYLGLVESDLQGHLWIGTNQGLCVWDPESKTSTRYDKTDKSARIEPKQNASFRDAEGKIWIGTINGALCFDPKISHVNPVESITHITAIKVFQDTIREENITLDHKRNYLSFYFNGICFSDPEKVRFKHRLTGFDDNWQESTLNFITYNNLSPGEYVFELKSCNNDGVWNKEPVRFSFKITPPFWMTWWFYTLTFLLVVLFVVVFIKYRERTLRLEKKHLEDVVNERTAKIVHQKEEIENQRDELKAYSNIIEQKNMSITDSIRYARRIQMATLPYSELIKRSLPQSFVFYKPKDIVSGDFYAFAHRGSKILFAVADCTGHGVPGAFMSMIGTNLFNQVINEKGITRPADILNELDKGIERALKQDETDNHDGMDIIIVSLDFEQGIFEMAGANRPLWIVRKEKIQPREGIEVYGDYMEIIRPDKHAIGGIASGAHGGFSNHTFKFEPGDMLYLSTDGYSDQFGGPLGKKLLSKRLRDQILAIRHKSLQVQLEQLEAYFEAWQGDLEQVDDVLVAMIRHHG